MPCCHLSPHCLIHFLSKYVVVPYLLQSLSVTCHVSDAFVLVLEQQLYLLSNYGQHSTLQDRLSNRSSMSLHLKRCPGVSSHHHACSNPSSGSSSSSVSLLASSKPVLIRHSLHFSSKLSPSIRMIRLCKMIHMRAHMMMIMWHLVLTSWIHISFKDWNVPFSIPIVCSTRICIYTVSSEMYHTSNMCNLP
jgi:hypothetical protein